MSTLWQVEVHAVILSKFSVMHAPHARRNCSIVCKSASESRRRCKRVARGVSRGRGTASGLLPHACLLEHGLWWGAMAASALRMFTHELAGNRCSSGQAWGARDQHERRRARHTGARRHSAPQAGTARLAGNALHGLGGVAWGCDARDWRIEVSNGICGTQRGGGRREAGRATMARASAGRASHESQREEGAYAEEAMAAPFQNEVRVHASKT